MTKDVDKEREMIKAAALKTAQKIVQPKAEKIDAEGQFPSDLFEAFNRQGLFALLLPEEYGGTDGDVTTFCMVIEEIAKVCGSSSLSILAQGVGALPIFIGGSPSQKETYFTRIAEEKNVISLAFFEEEARRDPSLIKTKAEKVGTDYLLNGRKCFITQGSVADLYTVFAVTSTNQGKEGLSAFIVEKGTEGLRFEKKEESLGMRGLTVADVVFENCRIPGENLIGEEGKGWDIAKRTLDILGVATGAQAVGIAQGAVDFAIRYAGERVQFGKPISSFQAIQFMMADMMTQVETARSLVYKAAENVLAQNDQGEYLSAIAKVFATDMAMRVATDAVQILGGYGYMKEYPVERMMRDAKVTQIYGEANQSQRLEVGKQLMR
jgi:alkylation response protein AidB-like acyl-CoA dehydrogenase